MEEITIKKIVLNTNEIKDIIKEHLSSKGFDVKIIDFYGLPSSNHLTKEDYFGEPKINLRTVVCQSYDKK
jgi:hypothetical protein